MAEGNFLNTGFELLEQEGRLGEFEELIQELEEGFLTYLEFHKNKGRGFINIHRPQYSGRR